MTKHVRILATLHIIFGSLGILAAVAVVLLFGGVAGVLKFSGDPDAAVAVPILGLIGGVFLFFTAILAISGIVAGLGLLQYREWARILTIVLSALHLVNVPFGTALGVYGLSVLLQDRTASLFRNAPLHSFPA
ncbi:MAG TPA: hypothetical protein PLA43_19950 [Bryobacteraceae bacterium]|mgnify:CR=1 FL=1|nr:hypothetical protein [Bryobacteraceae bacterium]HOL70135.1 hypothetical protein [Bryobacteraceae bacterium]HOQ46244.1 hypothetical protein [Bryobacteraceae bacterium]HPQ14921.1 hypothetical protein [Bryobacteraceae bacterium]HPU74233.1 hypothetical protein [Bryobacteraceae bacterium]